MISKRDCVQCKRSYQPALSNADDGESFCSQSCEWDWEDDFDDDDEDEDSD